MNTADKVKALEARHPSIRAARMNFVTSMLPDMAAEERTRIADKMIEEQAEGRNFCFRHVYSMLTGAIASCDCSECERARFEAYDEGRSVPCQHRDTGRGVCADCGVAL